MHYYQFNIGDYASHTRHLTQTEDLAYRRLLDEYYLHERPLNECPTSVARQINMRGMEEAVESILREFFTLSESGWINERADREIKHYQSKIEQASKAGKASAQRKLNARSTDVQPTNNQEPITNNHIKTPSSSGDDKQEKKHPDYQAIVDLYHRLLPSLPMVKVLTDKRKSSIRSCCSLKPSYYGLDFWEAYFDQASRSDFIMGRKTDWRADFDFLVTKSKFVKVLEGSYD